MLNGKPFRVTINGDYFIVGDEFGTSSGQPLVLLNGSAFNRHQWDKFLSKALIPKLGKRLRIVRYDYGGIGDSQGQIPDWSMTRLVDEFLSLSDHLNISKAHLYGISQGTMVAQAIIGECPERISSVAGYGWYYNRYSEIGNLHPRMIRRLKGLEDLRPVWSDPLDARIFKLLWDKVYKSIIINPRRSKLYTKILGVCLRKYLLPYMRPTPIRTIYNWFYYALNKLPKLEPEFTQAVHNFNGRVLVQHAINDETLPVKMAEELAEQFNSLVDLVLYSNSYTHFSIVFKSSQAKKIVNDYNDFLIKHGYL